MVSLFCVCSYPDISTELELTGEVATYFLYGRVIIPTTHALIAILQALINNPWITFDNARPWCSFFGMLLMVGLLLIVTEMLYHLPHFDPSYD